MSAAHDLLRQSSWTGVDLHELVEGALAPFRSRTDNDIIVDGERVRLTSKFGQSMALVLHELVTNAVKHGALSVPGGKVAVNWSRVATADGDKIGFSWRESGGPYCSKPVRNGFGLAVIRSAASECGRGCRDDFAPEGFQFDFKATFQHAPRWSARDISRSFHGREDLWRSPIFRRLQAAAFSSSRTKR